MHKNIKIIQNIISNIVWQSCYAFNFVLNCDLLACYFEDYSVCTEQITGAFNEPEEVVG